MLLAVLAFVALATLTLRATFAGNPDVSRWAAISTIWLTLPIMLAALIAVAALGAAVYLLTRLTGMLPTYTGRTQKVFFKIESGARRVAELTRKPVLFFKGLGAIVKTRLHRARERM